MRFLGNQCATPEWSSGKGTNKKTNALVLDLYRTEKALWASATATIRLYLLPLRALWLSRYWLWVVRLLSSLTCKHALLLLNVPQRALP
jgi:hypothetical protein